MHKWYINAKAFLKVVLCQYPKFTQWYVKRFHPVVAIGPDTDMVVEGFGRSANCFAVDCIRSSCSASLKMSHHLHMPGQLIVGVRRKVPTVVLVRHPLDAVTSTCIYHPGISPHVALLGYILFYKPLMKYRSEMVIADFGTITTNFSTIIKKVNAKYDTDFRENAHEELERDAFSRIDQFIRGRTDDRTLNMPSDERNALKPAIRAKVERSWLYPRAVKLYREFVAQTGDEQSTRRSNALACPV